MSAQDIVIIGAGGFAREVLWLLDEINEQQHSWNILGFVGDSSSGNGECCGLPILGDDEWMIERMPKSTKIVCGIGNPRLRKLLAAKFSKAGFAFSTIVHPNVRVSRFVDVGLGTIIAAGNILTTQIRVGSHVVLNLDCTIGHDAVIGDYCVVSPGAHISGSTVFGEGVEFGTGACIIQGKTVSEWSVIGAGSVVTSDIPPHVTAVGVPCKVIKQHQPSVNS